MGLLYLLCFSVVISTVFFALREQKSENHFALYLISHGFPMAMSVFMIFPFVIYKASPVVQGNAHNDSAMGIWSLWVDLFPVLFAMSFLNIFVHFGWLIVSLFKQDYKKHRLMSLGALLLAVLASFTILVFFPRA